MAKLSGIDYAIGTDITHNILGHGVITSHVPTNKNKCRVLFDNQTETRIVSAQNFVIVLKPKRPISIL